jgi:hypothetical protein
VLGVALAAAGAGTAAAAEKVSLRLKWLAQAQFAGFYVAKALCGEEELRWKAGDVFLLPGGGDTRLRAGVSAAVLWAVTNEPQLAFDGSVPAAKRDSPVDVVHYTADEIEQQFALLATTTTRADTAGQALIFSSLRQEASRIIMRAPWASIFFDASGISHAFPSCAAPRFSKDTRRTPGSGESAPISCPA